ncbi:hypothetical protein GK047_25945 [Paenibacillus sp. SYP-B3998]|uniref:DUF4302 domain-containing protein n=1 Tax=Paenibacillus sp. SYP-B3998 TaxID=2678564 RepID=A0A6G4A6D9_9BACL|nr:hypothetical protein [Paenibacillus sp. SYP-B3998]NEW09391.1 hypothetical protein [Paenibacillus sp. SYP-B3998]
MWKLVVVILFIIVSGCGSGNPESATRNSVESSTQAPQLSTLEPTSTTSAQDTKANAQQSKDFLYENKKLGFSLSFPTSWQGKYLIEDSAYGIVISFKANAEQTGYLRGIRIVSKDTWNTYKEAGFFRFLGERNGYVYIENSSLGAPFDSKGDKKNFDAWTKMQEQMADVLKTFQMLPEYEEGIFNKMRTMNLTIDRFKERGYKVEEKQIFARKFEDIGELTVTPVTKLGNNKDFPLSLILTGGKKDIVLTPNRKDGHAMFSSFEAISFKDIDDYSLKSGYTDIIVIANFITGGGQDGAKPFSDVFIFKNDTWGNFIEDTILENRIMGSSTSRTLTVKQVLDLAKPFDMKNFVGNFTKISSNEYDKSQINIESISDGKIKFAVDAFHVNGRAKGAETGNVNVGNIEEIATLDGYIATYKADDFDFELTFEFFGNDTFEVTAKGRSAFGANVSANGVYKRDL